MTNILEIRTKHEQSDQTADILRLRQAVANLAAADYALLRKFGNIKERRSAMYKAVLPTLYETPRSVAEQVLSDAVDAIAKRDDAASRVVQNTLASIASNLPPETQTISEPQATVTNINTKKSSDNIKPHAKVLLGTAAATALIFSIAPKAAAEPVDDGRNTITIDGTKQWGAVMVEDGVSLLENDVTAGGELPTERPAKPEVKASPEPSQAPAPEVPAPTTRATAEEPSLQDNDANENYNKSEVESTTETPPAADTPVETPAPVEQDTPAPATEQQPEPTVYQQPADANPDNNSSNQDPTPTVDTTDISQPSTSPETPSGDLSSLLDNLEQEVAPKPTVEVAELPDNYAQYIDDMTKELTDSYRSEKSSQNKVDELKDKVGELAATLTVLDVLANLAENPPQSHQPNDPEDKPKEDKPSDEKKDEESKPEESKDDKPSEEKNDDSNKEKDDKKSSKYDKLLNVIAKFESGGNYNAYFGHAGNKKIKFTSMSIGEVMEWQSNFLKNGSPSSAIGKYQFLNGTLKSLVKSLDISESQKFDKKLQDKLAISLLKRRGLNSYLSGKIGAKEFAHNLSKEWAALPRVIGKNPSSSYYDGDGLNKSHVKVSDILEAVKSIKDEPKERKARPSRSSEERPSSKSCDPRTEEIGTLKQKMRGPKGVGQYTIKLCAIPSIKSEYDDVFKGADGRAVVRAEASKQFQDLGEAYTRDTGKKLTVGDSTRTNELQSERNGGGTADPNAAAPTGSSNHEKGIAADFKLKGEYKKAETWRTCENRQTQNTPIYRWLNENAPKYGLHQYAAEAWHFDTSNSASRCKTPAKNVK